jgi:hypothetical protein
LNAPGEEESARLGIHFLLFLLSADAAGKSEVNEAILAPELPRMRAAGCHNDFGQFWKFSNSTAPANL